ncbi:MAG: glycerophosphodiester phosphodiesterase family protein [Aquabacterium sp.]
MKTLLALSAVAAAATLGAAPAHAYNTLDGAAPLVIAHRGASGYRPEHTLESYRLAIQLGANYIEPDLVMTKDGVLVARHEPIIGGTTDVALRPEFASRRTTKTIDGVVVANEWFVEDFTLAELKTLRAKQTRGRSTAYDGLYEVPTLDEVITLAKSESTRLGRTVGIYPELKHSTYMKGVSQSQGRGASYFEDQLVSTLHAAYGNTRNAPVFIQSFEVSNLQYLNSRTDIKLVQLIDADDVNPDGSMSLVAPYDKPYDFAVAGDPRTFADLLTTAGLAFIAGYADGVGPWKPYLVRTVADGVDRDNNGVVNINDRRVDGSTGVIEAAHAAGLLIHTWTFRNDASGYGFGDPVAEMAYYMRLGVDGVFTDFADTGVLAVAQVPEPGTYALMLLGLAAVAGVARRRR